MFPPFNSLPRVGADSSSTYTTTCPVTETVTGPGTTYTKVYTTTSVIKVKKPLCSITVG